MSLGVDATEPAATVGRVAVTEGGAAVFIRSKAGKGYTHHRLVEEYRDAAGRARHRTLASLGRTPTPETAVALARRVARAHQRRLEEIAPLAASNKRWAKVAARHRARLAELTHRIARLEEVERASG
jgi:hypothetical protein